MLARDRETKNESFSPRVSVIKQAAPKVLFVTLEFPTWADASHWSYIGNLGFEEGFAANGVEFFTLTANHSYAQKRTSWINYARELCSGQKFDQAWVEIVHSDLDESFLEWLTAVAPVRVALAFESLEITPEEWANNPRACQIRQNSLSKRLQYFTHILADDEIDFEKFNQKGGIPAMWFAGAIVPRRYICLQPVPVRQNVAFFYGAMYGERKKWLDRKELSELISCPSASPENFTRYPRLFDELHLAIQQGLDQKRVSRDLLFAYLRTLRKIRQKCFGLWLEGLQTGCAVVNLPQFGRAYASRVIEGMAAGRPVISWEIPNRPRTKELFEHGKEILLYSKEHPAQLAEHIRRIQRDRDFAQNIADQARRKVKEFHTTEDFVRKMLEWAGGAGRVVAKSGAVGTPKTPERQLPLAGVNFVDQLREAGIWQEGRPLRLHLGCGEQRFEGYINIDYPPSEHTLMNVKGNVYADITQLHFPPDIVDEIRLHHVFEHFSRVVALGMLIRWHQWLKVGGKLWIETPDLIGSAKTILSNTSWRAKAAAVRHLAGDQTASWAFHADHWFAERFEYTLRKFGFDPIQTENTSWPHEPHLANVQAIAWKARNRTPDELLKIADELLWESAVAESEKPTYELWRKQLHQMISQKKAACPSFGKSSGISSLADVSRPLKDSASDLPLDEIHDFNQRSRDRWVQAKAKTVPPGAKVLDIGAGTCPYRSYFSHCDYKTQDFMKYTGIKLGNTTDYGRIDYVSDVRSIPVSDDSFDVILCTEVLEHVPEPILALKEMARILKPGGRLFLTAPLGSGLHQLPYHFYGGFAPEFYKYLAPRFGLEIGEISSNGGFFKLMAQECARVASYLGQKGNFPKDGVSSVHRLFYEFLPRYLYGLDEKYFIGQFTVGYHVEMVKTKPHPCEGQ